MIGKSRRSLLGQRQQVSRRSIRRFQIQSIALKTLEILDELFGLRDCFNVEGIFAQVEPTV